MSKQQIRSEDFSHLFDHSDPPATILTHICPFINVHQSCTRSWIAGALGLVFISEVLDFIVVKSLWSALTTVLT